MKHHIKKVMLLITFACIIFNCQKDDAINHDETTKNNIHSPFNISKISKTKAFSNSSLKNKIETLANNIKQNKTQFLNKDVTSSNYGFTIDTDEVTYIEHLETNYHSYTFPIHRVTETSGLENLLLSLQPDGSYKTAIVNYNITTQDKIDIANGLIVNLENKVSSTTINDQGLVSDIFNKATECIEIVGAYCSYGNHVDGLLENGNNCPGYTEDVIATIGDCGSPGDSNSNNTDSNNTNDNTDNSSNNNNNNNNSSGTDGTNNQTNNGGSNNNTSSDGGPDVTLPVLSDLDEIELCLQFASGFTPEISSWLQEQSRDTIIKINNLIQSNNCNSNSQINVILIIQTMMSNSNLTIDEAIFEITDGLIIDLTDSESIDIEKELECFDLSQEAKLTIYVQQPTEDTDLVIGQNQTGHAFVGIEQNGIIRNFGYYPETGANEALLAVGVNYIPEIRRNNNYLYHVSISQNVSSPQLTQIVNYAINYPTPYNVNNYACTDYAIQIGNLGGMNLPSSTVSYLTFSGRSPGILGQEIRAMESNETRTITTNSNNSPSSQGGCN